MSTPSDLLRASHGWWSTLDEGETYHWREVKRMDPAPRLLVEVTPKTTEIVGLSQREVVAVWPHLVMSAARPGWSPFTGVIPALWGPVESTRLPSTFRAYPHLSRLPLVSATTNGIACQPVRLRLGAKSGPRLAWCWVVEWKNNNTRNAP